MEDADIEAITNHWANSDNTECQDLWNQIKEIQERIIEDMMLLEEVIDEYNQKCICAPGYVKCVYGPDECIPECDCCDMHFENTGSSATCCPHTHEGDPTHFHGAKVSHDVQVSHNN